MYPIKQSATLTVPFFAHDVNGDGVTGVADGSWTKRISKDGGAFAAMTVTITEMENGWYSLPLSTSHTDTLGLLSISLSSASSKRVNLQFRVHARLPDDLAFPTTSGRSIDVTTTGEVGIDWANIGSPGATQPLTATTIATTQKVDVETIKTNPVVNGGTITFPTGATLASTTNITAGTITTVTNLTNAPTNGDLTATMKTSVSTAVWDAATATYGIAGSYGLLLETNLDAAITSRLSSGTTGSGFTAIPWNAAWDAEVESEVNDALVVHRLDELLNADSDIDGAAPPTVGSVFHELLTKTAGSFTYDQTTDSLEALRDRGDAAWITATGFSTHTAADVWAVGTRVLTANTNLNIAGAVWDEDATGHQTQGTFGQAIGDPVADTNTIFKATVTDASGATVGVDSTAIKAKTDQLTFTTANQVDATTVTVSTGAIGTGDIATAALNEIADAILDRNMATGVDSGTEAVRTVRQALRALRNKVSISAGTAIITKENDVTQSWQAAITTAAGNPISAVDPLDA